MSDAIGYSIKRTQPKEEPQPVRSPKWFKKLMNTFLYAVAAGIIVGLGLTALSLVAWLCFLASRWLWQ